MSKGAGMEKSSEADLLVNKPIENKLSVFPSLGSEDGLGPARSARINSAGLTGRTTIALAAALLQAGCLTFIFLNALRVWMGLAAITAAGGGSFIHSGPMRYVLAGISLGAAVFTVGTVFNAAYLRRRQSAQWRRRPLTRRQKIANWFSVAASLASILLVWTELVMHHRLHPH